MALNAESIQLGPWHGGVRYDKPPEECAADELSDMENTRIDTAGRVLTRGGSASYSSAAAIVGDPTLTLCAQFRKDASTTYVVIIAGAAMYYYNSGWSAITGAVTITAADDNTFEWANCNGTLVATNGVDTDAIKWTGTGNATALDDDSRFSKAAHCAWWDNRLWMGNVYGATNRLWYSDTGDIETWGATSYYNFGGYITGIVAAQNALMVHTSEGLYTLQSTGSSAIPYRPNRRTRRAGLDGRSCVSLPDDSQMMILEDGIYMWAGGAELQKISLALDGPDYWDDIVTARLTQAFAVDYPATNEVWFVLPYGSGQTKMNHVMVWNRARKRWHGPYTGWERNCGALIDTTPHLGDFDGRLWDSDTGDDDGGAAITTNFQTAAVSAVGPDVKVRWLGTRCFYQGTGNYICTIQQQAGLEHASTQYINLRGGGFLLDTDALDSGALDLDDRGYELTQDVPLVGYAPSTSLRVVMNRAEQSFKFYKFVPRFKPLGRFPKPAPF